VQIERDNPVDSQSCPQRPTRQGCLINVGSSPLSRLSFQSGRCSARAKRHPCRPTGLPAQANPTRTTDRGAFAASGPAGSSSQSVVPWAQFRLSRWASHRSSTLRLGTASGELGLQALLGHASVATTGIYTKARPASLADVTKTGRYELSRSGKTTKADDTVSG
jgi:hypothetical protein